MSEGLDNFLSNIAQQSNFDEKPKEKQASKKKPKRDDDFSMNADVLLEGVKPSSSILDQIGTSSISSDFDAFYDFPPAENPKTSTSLTESQVRSIFREEMDRFFKEKQVLSESSNPQVIYFKVGNSLFKGTMELVKQG